MVQLTDELVEELDQVALRRSASRSEVIRDALRIYLSDLKAADIGDQIKAAYSTMPPTTPDTWGDPGTPGDVGSRELLERLDTEEQKAGHRPW